VWLKTQEAWRIGKHRTWVRPREAFTAQQLKKFLGMPPPHSRIVLAFIRPVAEIAPAIDDLLGRTAADSQLQASTSDQIRGVLLFVQNDQHLI
jgi:hypothetical protein